MPAAVKPEESKVKLTIYAKKGGWLQVKVDGNLVLRSTLREGAKETWTAEKEIEVSGKSIHNLEYTANGESLGELGKSDKGARRVIVTKNGLSVKK